jgi:hypothetical protein
MKKEKSIVGKFVAFVFVSLLIASNFLGVVPVIAQASPETSTVPDDYRTIPDAVNAALAAPPSYNIGDIPPQTVWHGQEVEFQVRSDAFGPEAVFDEIADPQPWGELSLNLSTGLFYSL